MPLKQHPTKPDMMIYTKTKYGNISAGKEWVGLTDEEVIDIWAGVSTGYDDEINIVHLGKAIEAKLKEKNNGNG